MNSSACEASRHHGKQRHKNHGCGHRFPACLCFCHWRVCKEAQGRPKYGDKNIQKCSNQGSKVRDVANLIRHTLTYISSRVSLVYCLTRGDRMCMLCPMALRHLMATYCKSWRLSCTSEPMLQVNLGSATYRLHTKAWEALLQGCGAGLHHCGSKCSEPIEIKQSLYHNISCQ